MARDPEAPADQLSTVDRLDRLDAAAEQLAAIALLGSGSMTVRSSPVLRGYVNRHRARLVEAEGAELAKQRAAAGAH